MITTVEQLNMWLALFLKEKFGMIYLKISTYVHKKIWKILYGMKNFLTRSLVLEFIYTSVKGMPTGISIEHPDAGYAGYWSNIFIIFEDKQLKFDIGRKSIHGMISRIYKNFAREIFNYYLKYITKYVSGEVVTNTEWDRDDVFANIDNIIDLRNPKIQLVKNPKRIWWKCIWIIFECIGNKKIEKLSHLFQVLEINMIFTQNGK